MTETNCYYYNNRFTALCPGLPGWAGTTGCSRKKSTKFTGP